MTHFMFLHAYIEDCDCLCKCCKDQGIPKKCLYRPFEKIQVNSTHKEIKVVELNECAKHAEQLTQCRSKCVSGN